MKPKIKAYPTTARILFLLKQFLDLTYYLRVVTNKTVCVRKFVPADTVYFKDFILFTI